MSRTKGAKNKNHKPLLDCATDVEIEQSEINADLLPQGILPDVNIAPVENVKPRLTKDEKEQAAIVERKSKLTPEHYNQMTILVKGLFSVIAIKAGERWNLSDDEAGIIGQPATRLMAKYIDPDKLQYADEITLSTALIAIIGKRVYEQRKESIVNSETPT